MRKIFISAILLFSVLSGLSQEMKYLDIKSFQCDFKEERTIRSLDSTFIYEGVITYNASETIIEYITPERLVIKKDSLDNVSVLKNNEPMKTNATHKQKVNFIENILTYDFKDNSEDYNIETTSNAEHFIAILSPKKKSRIESMEFYLDKTNDNIISRIIVKESKGNITTISVSNIKTSM